MAKDLKNDLDQYLAENPCKGFRPGPRYFPTGDYLTLYVKDGAVYAERVDDLLTVYLSMATARWSVSKSKACADCLRS